jgi:hypothetical protein
MEKAASRVCKISLTPPAPVRRGIYYKDMTMTIFYSASTNTCAADSGATYTIQQAIALKQAGFPITIIYC